MMTNLRRRQRLACLEMLVDQLQGAITAMRQAKDESAYLRAGFYAAKLRDDIDTVMTAIILEGTLDDRDVMRELTEPVPAIDASGLLIYVEA
jgi:hypothetical protein